MFERFTAEARAAVAQAESEARELGHNYVGTEHLLLGMLVQEGTAARALTALQVDAERVRAQIIAVIGRGDVPPAGPIPFTPRAKKLFELAIRQAMDLGESVVETEHVLLALTREGEGVGAQVLVQLGVRLNDVRIAVIRLLSAAPRKPSGGRNERLLTELRGIFAENARLHDEVARLTELLRRNGIDPS